MSEDRRLAVLIDADNVSKKYIRAILEEVSNFGAATYKRIYGDWTRNNGWKDVLLENSIIPIQQYSYTTGKNATDSAMIIDAMDILYSGHVDGFCLVSSDSDFTRLAARLREAGMVVIGMGENKTPNAFRKACNIFRILEVISGEQDTRENSTGDREKTQVTPAAEIEASVCKIIMENTDSGKETQIGEIGSKLNLLYPDFDVRNYGYSKLTTFLKEKCRSVSLNVYKNHISLTLKDSTDDIETIVKSYLRANGGTESLSRISNEIYRHYPDFNLKNLGYSKFSTYIRSMDGIELIDQDNVHLPEALKGETKQ